MKETQVSGYIQVAVRGANGMQHVTNLPATNVNAMADISSRVKYAPSIALS